MARGTSIDEMYIKIGADISEIKQALGQVDRKTKSTSSSMEGSLGKIGAAMAASFSVGAIISFSKQVIEVRSQFERFEAVLGNTLGSKGAATKIMSDIKTMAAETPFQVSQLTDAFVRLTNYGMKPSMDELKKMGDLSSAVGKSILQLSEAVADAATGQFERLKEFGIKAAKQGDKVTFTFKGISTQVDYTADSIKSYLVSLGDLDGVHGAMAVQMDTLGGKVSNLGDAWDSLLVTIGDSSAWGSVVSGLKDAITWTEKWIKASGELGFINPMGAFSSYQIEVGAKLADARKKFNAEMTAQAEANQKAGVTPAGPLMPGQGRVTGAQAGMLLMTVDETTGTAKFHEKKVKQEKIKTEAQLKKEAKARAEARREIAMSAQAFKDLKLQTEMLNFQANVRAGKMRKEVIGNQGLSSVFDKPRILGSEDRFDSKQAELASRLRGDITMADSDPQKMVEEGTFAYIDSAVTLSDGLVAAAFDMQNAGQIIISTISRVITEMIAQSSNAQLAAFAGPIGGLIAGGLSMALKGKDLETSRSRTSNSIARYN